LQHHRALRHQRDQHVCVHRQFVNVPGVAGVVGAELN